MREFRDSMEELERVLVAAPSGVQIPLGQLADVRYTRGPQVIKGEDGFLVGYVLFDRETGWAEVDVVEQCRNYAGGYIRGPFGRAARYWLHIYW